MSVPGGYAGTAIEMPKHANLTDEALRAQEALRQSDQLRRIAAE